MPYAKLSTAITLSFGPILDSTGAEYTGAAVGDVKICKNNGTPAALNGSATLTHKEVGMYELVLTTSDISAVGEATIQLSKTTYVAPPIHLIVLPAKVYDSLVGGTDNLEVDAIQWLGTAPLALSSQQVQAIVPDSQKVDVSTIKTRAVTDVGAGNTVYLGTSAWSTLTQTQVSGGAYDLTNSTFVAAFKSALGTVPASGNWAVAGDDMALTSDERNSVADALLDRANAIDTKTVRQALRINSAILAGEVSGAGTGEETFVGLDGTTTRAVVTVDSSGNRTGVTYP